MTSDLFPDYLTIEDIASLIAIHPETVRRWIRAGRFRAVRPPGTRRFYVAREEWERFLNSCYEPALPEKSDLAA